MNPYPQNNFASKTGSGSKSGSGEAETTLRLIAGLPAPEGLEERVKAALHQTVHNAAQSKSLLHWPLTSRLGVSRFDTPRFGSPWLGSSRIGWLQSTWVRTAAAAAIVFVVAGGGWEIYSHVQPAEQPKAIALPPVSAHGGFSSANAIRTPRTLDGTVLTHPLAAPKQSDSALQRKPANHIKKPVRIGNAETTKTVAP